MGGRMSVTAGASVVSVADPVALEINPEPLAGIRKLPAICPQDLDFKSHAA